MDYKEPKTEEAPASLQPGPAGASLRPRLVEAQKVTSNDKNETKPIGDPGRVTAAKNFLNTTEKSERKKKKRGGSRQP